MENICNILCTQSTQQVPLAVALLSAEGFSSVFSLYLAHH